MYKLIRVVRSFLKALWSVLWVLPTVAVLVLAVVITSIGFGSDNAKSMFRSMGGD